MMGIAPLHVQLIYLRTISIRFPYRCFPLHEVSGSCLLSQYEGVLSFFGRSSSHAYLRASQPDRVLVQAEKYSNCNPLPYALCPSRRVRHENTWIHCPSPSNSHVYPHTSKLQIRSSALNLPFRTLRTRIVSKGGSCAVALKTKAIKLQVDVFRC